MPKSAARKTTKARKPKKAATAPKKPQGAGASRSTKKRAAAARSPVPRAKTGEKSARVKPTPGVTAARAPRATSPPRPAVRVTYPAAVTETRESRPEKPLTREEIEQFRHMLLEKRAEILGDVSTLHNEALNKDRREAAGDLSSMPIHMADLGTDNYELEFTLGLIEGERAILKEVEEALERIQQGTYGFCLATGKPIGKARLKAKPWAKYCYEYTLAQEQGQVRRF